MEELKTVKLLGAAGRKFGREFRIAVSSPAEAVRAICALRPEFYGWVLEQHQRGVAWRVVTDSSDGISADELERTTGQETIILAPVLIGAGGGFWSGLGQIVLGIALVAVAVFVPFGAVAGGLGWGLLGGSLILSGIATLITPTPQLSGPKAAGGPASYSSGTSASKSADLESNLFSRGQGTGAQGEAVPLVYGIRRVTSPRIISFSLRNFPSSREIDTADTDGLLGYVNEVELT